MHVSLLMNSSCLPDGACRYRRAVGYNVNDIFKMLGVKEKNRLSLSSAVISSVLTCLFIYLL